MRRKLSLVLRIFNSFGLSSSITFLIAHIFKWKSVAVYIKELNQQISVRPWTGDFATIRQVIWDKEYDFELDKVDTIVDLGANIGVSTITMARKFPHAKVIALEPEKSNFQLLTSNTREISNIRVLNYAIWYKDGEVEIQNKNVKSNAFKFKDTNAHTGSEMVRSISIDSLMTEYGLQKIDLLKIDIEGAEEDLFFKSDLAWLTKVNCIIIEIHSPDFKVQLLEMMRPRFQSTDKGEKILFTKNSV